MTATRVDGAAVRLRVDALRESTRRAPAAALRLVRHSDLAIGYAVVLVVVTVVLLALGPDTYDRVVDESSTNLANLRNRPVTVLVTSLFVVSSPLGLWILPVLLLVYATAQRWVGRAGTVVVALAGHVGATLVVATELSAGIAHGYLERTLVVHAQDVGVSYALVCLAAFITPRVPRAWRAPYLVVVIAYVVVPFVMDTSFTDVGHLVSLLLGGSLALLAVRVRRAAVADSD